MRIQGGRFHNKPIAVPQEQYVRPAGARMREALTNILAGQGALQEATVVDVFCGSGVLGLEALSHGASRATFLELDGAVLRHAQANGDSLGVTTGNPAPARFVRADATQPPAADKGEAATLAFIDPPYGSGLAERALPALADRGWLAPGAICVVHVAQKDSFAPSAGFALDDQRRYGRAHVYLLTYEGEEG